MVHPCATLLKCFVFFSIILCLKLSIVKGEPDGSTVPWYESLPAVAMDYKVHIDPGKEDCYFQYVNAGATFYVSFQVGKSHYLFQIVQYIVYQRPTLVEMKN